MTLKYIKYTIAILLVIVTLALSYIAIWAKFVREYDISTYTPFRTTKHRNWLISFAGGEVHESNQNYLHSASINRGFKVIIDYGINDVDKTYIKKHKEIFSQKRGSGYWLWKPYIIDKTLTMMNYGDILFYVDSGVVILENTDFFTDKMDEDKSDILLFKSFHKNRRFTKRDTYSMMGADEKYAQHPQFGATIVIVRKTDRSIKFIKEWMRYCENPKLLTDEPSKKEEYPDFIEHRHDQSILTMLYYKDPAKITIMDYHAKGICEKFFHHRRRTHFPMLLINKLKLFIDTCDTKSMIEACGGGDV
ncbi:MAG: hypothetical protein KA998_00565 [Rickettsiaceae bacterium]|nr:hypothetical protein [Rickettsiaceae bacterium]